MKKTMKKSLLLLALTAIMVFAMGITASAVTNAKVTGLKQTDASETNVSIQWNATPSADLKGYYIYLSTDGKTFSRVDTDKYPDAYNASGTVSKLSAGQKYYVKVAAVYDAGNYNYVAGPQSDAISIVTAPKKVDYTTIKQTGASASKKTASIKWTYSAGASGYRVTFDGKSVITSKTSATIKAGLGKYGSVKVEAFKKSNEGFIAYSYSSSSSDYIYGAPTTPKYVAAGKRGNLVWYPTESNKVKVYWEMASGYGSTVDGYQVQIWSLDGKKKLKTYNIKNVYSMNKEFNIKAVKNTGFRVCVRAYNKVNGKTIYGNWTKKKAVVPQAAVKIEKRTGRNSFRSTWSKVKNVQKYYVYVCKDTSKPDKDQVWKKVATLSKNATSYNATGLTTGKYPGIYVIPVVKVGGRSYKADATWYKYTYLSSYYD